MDGGYDDNKMFLKLDELGQDYTIRLTAKRKLLYHNKWTMATQLCNRRKGKIKTSLFYKGKEHEACLSHVKVQITASKKDMQELISHAGKSKNISAAKSRCSSLKNFVCASLKQSTRLTFISPYAWRFLQ